jgi:UDP-GlcNAc:undecaprenyl-phosphate GlcNAc-1-phosphate transferase
MPFKPTYLIPVAASFALALILTPIVRHLAQRWKVVAKPKTDRWHKKPTAMLGGVAMFLSVALVIAIYLLFVPPRADELLNHDRDYLWVVLGASAFLFAVGLVDDLYHAKPYQKLIGQVMGAAFVIYYGLSLPWTGSATVNIVITIFWLIGITNAINLLDNMDGLSAGIAAIASVFLAVSFLASAQPTEALMLMVFAAALIGFLVYNSNPASIFMGDCGSMFIGFFLASTSLMSAAQGGRSRSFLPVLAVPILILFIPIFDTVLVTVLRKLSGRSVRVGGRDHASHRLVALGMSERRAVWMLYGFAGLSGLLALLVREAKIDVALAAIGGFTVVLTLLGVYLAGVKVYDEDEVKLAREKPLFAFLVDLSYKRRIFEVSLDLVLIVLAYYGAYVLRFGPMESNGVWRVFLRTLPVLLFFKMAMFLVMGIYRGIWRYTSVDDLVVFAKAVALGSVASLLAILFAFRFEGVSRTVFIVDAIILFMLLAGSRMAFRLFRRLLPTQVSSDGCRVLIYGAGDGGELLLREMQNNRELQYAPVGFVDDDPNKKGKVIHGLRVFGGNGSLRAICEQQRVDEVLISSSRFTPERIAEILNDCREADVTLKRMRIRIEEISTEY